MDMARIDRITKRTTFSSCPISVPAKLVNMTMSPIEARP